jgi:CheY-like chemotaxis protein
VCTVNNPRSRLLAGVRLAALLGIAVVARSGWTRLAASFYLGGLWRFVTLSLWLFGGFQTPASCAHTVVALAAALVFGVRGTAVATALIAISSVPASGGTAPARHAALTVRDTGHGMDEETRAQAFEPFFTTKAGSGGTGLGLSMVYGIVQQSRGRIAVESAPERGSCFRILLPCAEGPGEAHETVLVVEDEPALRALASEMPELHGYLTIGTGSGEEALGLALRHTGPIHLLLADVVMPGLAGPALAEPPTDPESRPRLHPPDGFRPPGG